MYCASCAVCYPDQYIRTKYIQGGSNMTGTDWQLWFKIMA